MTSYIITAHVSRNENNIDNFGPPHAVYEFLSKKSKTATFFKHSLHGKFPSEIVSTVSTRIQKKGKLFDRNILVRSLEHIWINVRSVWGKKGGKDRIIYIGTDPVNSVSGLLLKLFQRIDKNIYFNADYASARYQNKFLNHIYHLSDRISLRFADEVWCVSTRITKKREDQGLSSRKIKLLPNSPLFDEVPRYKYNGNHNLVWVAHLTRTLDIAPVLKTIKSLQKKYRNIRLIIVGSGPSETQMKLLVKKMELNNIVKFTGQKTHRAALETIARSFVGLALYSGKSAWNMYGDSQKAREYLAAGIPVIISEFIATSEDIVKYKTGIAVDESNKEARIVSFVSKCIEDTTYYNTLKKNALELAKIRDKNVVLSKLLNQI